MPEREYLIRGNPVTVEEIPGVVAVKLELSADEDVAAQEREAALQALGGEATLDMPDTERKAFSAAGWVFVSQPAPGPLRIPDEVRASHTGPVFRRSSGRMLIGSDRLAVKLQPTLSPAEAMRLLVVEEGVEVPREISFAAPNAYEIEVPPGQDFLEVARRLRHRGEFVYAEPEMIQHLGQRWAPSDPRYGLQWQWENNGADVGAEIAWNHATGAGVRLAIIDLGFDVGHLDLTAAIAPHGSGYFERRGIDADFMPGLTGFPDDDHGTFCAGIAAARANNGEGGCGIAFGAELMLVACLNPFGVGRQSTLARAIAYAADPKKEDKRANSPPGADVISCSVGPDDGDWELESRLDEALEFATQKGRNRLGVPIFWAVGNDYHPVARDPVASHPAVIAVGSSTDADLSGGSAWGRPLQFLAPGVEVYSTNSGGRYGRDNGTSFAAPCAAGIAALVLEGHPGLKWKQVRKKLRDACDKVGGVSYTRGWHKDYGYGRVNAGKAV